MEWFVWLAPVPVPGVPAAYAADVLRLQAAAPVVSYLALVAACAPVVLALRERFRGTKTRPAAPRLTVLEGRKEVRRRAA